MKNSCFLSSENIKTIHFTGIGGISMSGLAEILADEGYIITGSDIRSSSIIQKLEKMGIKIKIGHEAENIRGADLVVYTAAVKPDNPELAAARQKGIPCVDRAALLGEIMSKYTAGIAVAGTHGKTTTTSMISMIMLKEGLDPTVHIGGELDAIGGSTRIGGKKYFITEACEYTGSFLKLHPYLAIILNVEYDHADYYKNYGQVKNAFLEFAKLVPENGHLLVNGDDRSAVEIMGRVRCNKTVYSLSDGEKDWSAANVRFEDSGFTSYTLMHRNKPVCEIQLRVPGMYNVSNSLAAIAACSLMGCSLESAAKALSEFGGAHRRFELKGVSGGIKVIDDYAHHPSEVAATLKAARKYARSRIWCVFQPHTYSRTKFLMDGFAAAFYNADTVILADIYAAREIDTGEVNSAMLADKIAESGKQALYIKGFDKIVEYLDKNAAPGDLIITMGAGDVYKVGDMFLNVRKGPNMG